MNNKDKIKEAKHILNMFEADEINHDEVNARVWCLINNYLFHSIKKHGIFVAENLSNNYPLPDISNGLSALEYSTSLDACKSIIPEGFFFNLSTGGEGIWCNFGTDENSPSEYGGGSGNRKTMELAWLHAILQSMIWEWEQ